MLTEEQKSDYKKKAEDYRILNKKNRDEILQHKSEISNFEKEIAESMPKTPKAVRVCEDCGVMSVKYIGRENNNIKSQHIYVCEICGRKYNSMV